MALRDLSPQPWHDIIEFTVELSVPCASLRRKRPRRQVEYLHHPRCPAEDVLRLRAEGISLKRISIMFGVSNVIVLRVFDALKAANPEAVKALPPIKRTYTKKALIPCSGAGELDMESDGQPQF